MTKINHYEITEPAALDLENIFYYGVLRYGEQKAQIHLEKIFNFFDQIGKWPFAYTAESNNIRKAVFLQYAILYEPIDEHVIIHRIFSKQDLKYEF